MDSNNEDKYILILLIVISILTLSDVLVDASEGTTLAHVLTELVIAISSILGIWFLWRRNSKQTKSRLTDAQLLQEKSFLEAEHWKQQLINKNKGLGEAIVNQFGIWKLTTSEGDVAFLLLKGFSLKEIATIRGVSERTVKNQSLVVYKKSSVSGRAELSAFFLEELL